MAYERVNWENLPSKNTPINQTNLNNMENGIAEIDKTVGLKGYLDNNTDLNNVTEKGIYSTGNRTLTNAPVSNYDWAFLIVLNQNNVTQQYFIKPVAGAICVREYTGSPAKWSEWKKMYIEDSGWIDMSSYVNTEYFTPRPGLGPQLRRIGNVVYWRGEVYCHKAIQSIQAQILKNIPTTYLPTKQVSGGSMQFSNDAPYVMFLGNDRQIQVRTSANIIDVSKEYSGFSLSCISGYPV